MFKVTHDLPAKNVYLMSSHVYQRAHGLFMSSIGGGRSSSDGARLTRAERLAAAVLKWSQGMGRINRRWYPSCLAMIVVGGRYRIIFPVHRGHRFGHWVLYHLQCEHTAFSLTRYDSLYRRAPLDEEECIRAVITSMIPHFPSTTTLTQVGQTADQGNTLDCGVYALATIEGLITGTDSVVVDSDSAGVYRTSVATRCDDIADSLG
jgi:hypothetical protein